MDNIFVLNHIIQRKRENKKESQKVYALFINLKAAFNNVDMYDNVSRGKLWSIMEKKGIDIKGKGDRENQINI